MHESQIEWVIEEVLARLSGERSPATGTSPGAAPSTLVLTEQPSRVLSRLAALPDASRRRFALATTAQSSGDASTAYARDVISLPDRQQVEYSLLSRFGLFYLVDLSLPTIAKLAQLLVTEPIVEVVFHALCDSKPVSMEPVPVRDDYQQLPAGVRGEFDLFLEKIRGYGVREESLIGRTEDRPTTDIPGWSRAGANSGASPVGAIETLTVDEIRELCRVGGNHIELPTGTRLTDLAAEYLVSKGISITYR